MANGLSLSMTLTLIAIFSGVILLGVGVYFVSKHVQKEEQEGKPYLPDDGLIYDPVSGRNLTVEEAEAGIIVSDEEASRIKSDEEIEAFYSGPEKEREYIERDLILSGATSMEDQELPWLDDSDMVRRLVKFGLSSMYQIAPGRYLGVATVVHHYSIGSEPQFIGFISGTLADQEMPEALEIETLPAGTLWRLPRIATRADLDRVLTFARNVRTTGA